MVITVLDVELTSWGQLSVTYFWLKTSIVRR